MPSTIRLLNPRWFALTVFMAAAAVAAPSTLGVVAPTSTPSPTPVACVHAATLTLECAGGVGLGGQASNARLRFHAGIQDATACGLAACPTDTILVDTVINAAAWTGSTDCVAVTNGLLGDIAAGIDAQSGGSMSWTIVTGAGRTPSILVLSEVPFHCCFCGSEIGAPCMANRGYPLGVCALYNLADGIPGNQTDDPADFVSGLGLACFESACPPAPTTTPTPTNTLPPQTPTPSSTPSTTSTPSATPTPPPPTATPTETPFRCDSGYYILDSLGGRHRVGNPVDIVGPIYFGTNIARDLERAVCDIGGATHEDLVVLDGYGLAHFVEDAACNVPQDFYFGDMETMIEFPQGRAVDLQMTADSAGFWVLTDFGEIYRAGSALGGASTPEVGVGQNGVLGFDIPTMRLPGTLNLPSAGTSQRAVSLVAIDEDQNSVADGYIVLDSLGGRFHYLPDGSPVPSGISAGLVGNEPLRLLDPTGYEWPFFPGLDIARDMEPHPGEGGVVLFDGWGGVHPVPVDNRDNPVWFARNEDPLGGGPAQMVGLPYIVLGFDDPTTGPGMDEGDPSEYGLDAASIFTDLEFSAGCPDSGLYTLDKFGGVFALGSARATETEPVPGFGNSPYFYPFLYAEALEVFAGDETGFGETETGFTIELVTLPPGSFLMGNTGAARDQYCWCSGCDCEEPRHTVTINYSFQMGKYEVTNAQYAEVLNWAKGRGYLRNSSNQPYNGGEVYHNGQPLLVLGYDISYSGGQFASITRNSESMANHPVKVVSWYGSVAFCNWLSEKEGRSPAYNLSTWSLINRQGGGYRLPSESEWEYACRGSASNPYRYAPFSFGDDPNLDLNSCNFSSILDNYMVWCGNDDGWSEAVGSKLPNDYGLYDMHGNIWEWCQDWWHESYNGTGRPDDGRPWESPTSSYRVVRGGAWIFLARGCRSALRHGHYPDGRGNYIGFRFARTP